ncbi:hypothetical protein Micbo1qcDRAFT_224796 [Microdochium bolleyi]|uniref:Dynamin GTPase domain-containing protein n=1 Tax=Microdochium bolleyi TaxID=196109 RepID=A0A136IJH2_9PEZI|nr:hypothetical protein Micbo1qcDRAFT_224796 [Microdochium bolleyi]
MVVTTVQKDTLQDLCSTDRLELMDAINRLRSEGIGYVISLPQIIVVGERVSGKSSVLEAIFPAQGNLRTRFPTEVVLRRTSQVSARVSAVPQMSRDDWGKPLFEMNHLLERVGDLDVTVLELQLCIESPDRREPVHQDAKVMLKTKRERAVMTTANAKNTGGAKAMTNMHELHAAIFRATIWRGQVMPPSEHAYVRGQAVHEPFRGRDVVEAEVCPTDLLQDTSEEASGEGGLYNADDEVADELRFEVVSRARQLLEESIGNCCGCHKHPPLDLDVTLCFILSLEEPLIEENQYAPQGEQDYHDSPPSQLSSFDIGPVNARNDAPSGAVPIINNLAGTAALASSSLARQADTLLANYREVTMLESGEVWSHNILVAYQLIARDGVDEQ